MGLQVVIGSHYLVIFIGDQAEETEWLEGKVHGWNAYVKVIYGVERRHPYTAYDGMQNYLQQEWDFIQNVNPSVGGAFFPVDEALQKTFLLALLRGATDRILERGLTRLPVNQYRLATPNPTMSASYSFMASCIITGHLVSALQGWTDFQTGDHTLLLKEGRHEIRR